MCKIKTILKINDQLRYTATIDVDLFTISSIDVPSGCIIDFYNEGSMTIQYKFPESTEEVIQYPKNEDSKLKFRFGKISGKIHQYSVDKEEIIHQTDTFRILTDLFNMSNSERFHRNIKGFLCLSSYLIKYIVDLLSENNPENQIINTKQHANVDESIECHEP